MGLTIPPPCKGGKWPRGSSRNGVGSIPSQFIDAVRERLLHVRGVFLFGRMEKDCGAVLDPEIRPLPVQLRGTEILEKRVGKSVIANLRRIDSHLHNFRVPGAVAAHRFVGRIMRPSAGVARHRVEDARRLRKEGFHPPRTSGSQ